MGNKRSSNNNKRRKKRFFKLKWLGSLLLLALIASVVSYRLYNVKIKPLKERAAVYNLSEIDDVEVVSKILDRKGREIGRIFVENRDKISIKEVPQIMINALVAGEDQRFFKHDGVDRLGVARAVYLNLKARRQTQGASTLTQQLARNAFHLKEEADKYGEGGLERKAVEAYLALRIEKVYKKHEILEFYLNRIPFGSGYYGIRSAALGYFGKEPRDLSIAECASLVGCIKNPTRISPLNSLAENKKARNQVLRRLAAEEFLTEKESELLQQTPVIVNPKPFRRGTSHLYERVASAVRARLGEDALTEGGFEIHTTIDLDVQKALEKNLLRELAATEAREGYSHPRYEEYRKEDGRPNYLQGAGLIINNSNSSVIAYVAGRDFTHSQYDFIKSGRKPIGTAFLPFIYTAALEKNMSAASRMTDSPMDNRAIMLGAREGILGEWGMESLTPDYEGNISMRRAMEVSKISASVRLGKELGLSTVMGTARKFGLIFPEKKLLTRMLVGTSDASLSMLVRSYATFPNKGVAPKPIFFIDHIIDYNGDTRYKAEIKKESKRVTSAQTAFLMHTMLQSSLQNGTGAEGPSELTNDDSMAGKTGTTHDFADNWFIGYNSEITCGMWMGFLSGSRDAIYPVAFSHETVMPAWIDTMNTASQEFPGVQIKEPKGISRREICKNSGLRKTRYCLELVRDSISGTESYQPTTLNEYFSEGTEPSEYCDIHGMMDDSLTDSQDFGADGAKIARSYSIPIQPKQPLLLGEDPYGTELPDFAPRDIQPAANNISVMNFDHLDQEDKDAAIILPRPRRIEINEE